MKLLIVIPLTVETVRCPYNVTVQPILAFMPRHTPVVGGVFCTKCKFHNGSIKSYPSFYVKCSYENHQDRNARK